MVSRNFNIVAPLRRTAASFPHRTALDFGGDAITYEAFASLAARLAAQLAPRLRTRRVGILASRSLAAYVGLAGAAWAGAAYVPLNAKWPAERLTRLLATMKLDALVVDGNGGTALTGAVLAAAPALIVRADDVEIAAASTALSQLPQTAMREPAFVAADHPAYVLYTSGTTGVPKGVVVSCASLGRYLAQTRGWADFVPEDRVAEAHDISFDLSVHNAFLAWAAGSSLHVMTALDLMAPQRFIRSRAITCWMSVPTVASMMRTAGALKPGVFPSLRLSIFCGEPLPLPLAEAWAAAASHSVIENIYGPTECTVVCMRQRFTQPPVVTTRRNILAIGKPFANFTVALLDSALQPVQTGQVGEIALRSAQLSDGYLDAPEETARRFRTFGGERWYLTGDLGVQDADGTYHHMGRIDNQVKLKGNRVELEEVEAHLRRAVGTDLACVVAWPVVDGSAQGLVAFSTDRAMSPAAIQAEMARTLPRYMIPTRIEFVPELPRNSNGKTDRRALVALLDAAGAIPDRKRA